MFSWFGFQIICNTSLDLWHKPLLCTRDSPSYSLLCTWPGQGMSTGQALQIKGCVHNWFWDKFHFPCSKMVQLAEILFPQLHSKYNQSKLLRVMAQKPQFQEVAQRHSESRRKGCGRQFANAQKLSVSEQASCTPERLGTGLSPLFFPQQQPFLNKGVFTRRTWET